MSAIQVRASAPGKLVIVGEYAVLYGAPGLVCAVPRRARVRLTVQPGGDGKPGWRISTPPIEPVPATCTWRRGLPEPAPALLRAVLASLGSAAERLPRDGVELVMDTREFHDPQRQAKLGFGSSAALATALLGALGHCAREPADLALALDAHRRFQSGAGSGIDVAASWRGGVLSYLPGSPPAITTLTWPPGLQARVVWSGQAASTTDRLQRLAEFRTARPQAARTLLAPLIELSHAAAGALAVPDDFLALCQEFTGALRALSEAAGLAVWTPAHQQIAELAAARNVVYKTSGAGGGDCGLALAQDADALADLGRALAGRGLTSWSLSVASRGLEIDPSQGG